MPAPSSRPIDGRATFTTVMSSPTMNRLNEQISRMPILPRRVGTDGSITIMKPSLSPLVKILEARTGRRPTGASALFERQAESSGSLRRVADRVGPMGGHHRQALAMVVLLGALLLGAAPARASSVSNLTVANGSPSNAAGARTQYVVTLSTSAAGALGSAGTVDVTFPAGTTFANYGSGGVFV